MGRNLKPLLEATLLALGGFIFLTAAPVWAEIYEYDELNRLRKVIYDSGDYIEYEYDAAGNITRVFSPDMPPEAVDDAVTVTEDDPATAIAALVNDADVDGGPMSIESVTQPENGSVAITSGGADLTYEPDPGYCNEGAATDDFAYVLRPGGALGEVRVRVVCVNDPPAVVPPAPGTQIVQYSDWAKPIRIAATDIDSESLVLSVDGLPEGLNASGSCAVADGGSTCEWTIGGQVLSASGTYTLEVAVSDGESPSSTAGEIVVRAEDASVAFPDESDVADSADPPGGQGGEFTIAVLVSETLPDAADNEAAPGDIDLAEVSMTLRPAGRGGPVSGVCKAEPARAGGYETRLRAGCTFGDVAVDSYAVEATVAGDYYTGHAEKELVVSESSLGPAPRGGRSYWPAYVFFALAVGGVLIWIWTRSAVARRRPGSAGRRR